MADLTIVTPTIAGVAESMVAAAVGGDAFVNDGNTLLRVNNASGGSINVTIASQYSVNQTLPPGTANANQVVAVGAGTSKVIGPFPKGSWNDANGKVQVSYSAVTSVTVGAIKITR
ncbi:MAG: hypothetical protein U1E45_15040 [Geminicoccaceae bacterium]